MADHVHHAWRDYVIKWFMALAQRATRHRMQQIKCNVYGLIEEKMKYYVYAIWSEEFNKIYVGFSKNPNNRLNQHNAGRSKYTRRHMPWQLFFTEEVADRLKARKKEIYYKSGWGRKKLHLYLEEWQSGRMRQS